MGLPIIGDIIDAAGDLFGKAFGDKTERDRAKADFENKLANLHSLQALTNIEQAKHGSIFVAGARPAIMWVCALALAYQYVGYPFLKFALVVFAPDFPVEQLPAIDPNGDLTEILMGLLGLGMMRTYEKVKGVHTTHTSPKKKK